MSWINFTRTTHQRSFISQKNHSIAEKNSFTNQFFLQPLVQWNPNPSTIFYLGGNQRTLEEIDELQFQLFQFNRTQFFFKFKYLIGI